MDFHLIIVCNEEKSDEFARTTGANSMNDVCCHHEQRMLPSQPAGAAITASVCCHHEQPSAPERLNVAA